MKIIRYMDKDGAEYIEPFESAQATPHGAFYINGRYVTEEQYLWIIQESPGMSYACRCEECKLVAQSMAEAGYLEDVEDKWWES